MNTDNTLHCNILMFESVLHSLYLFCVCCLLMELITPNNFKRVSQKKRMSQSSGHHTLGDTRRAVLTHGINPVRSCQQNAAWPNGQSSKSRWTGCPAAGFLPEQMDTSSARGPFY